MQSVMGRNEIRHMLGRTGRRVGARDTEDHDLLALDLRQYIDWIWSDGTTFGFDFNEFIEHASWQVVTNLDHSQSSKDSGR